MAVNVLSYDPDMKKILQAALANGTQRICGMIFGMS